MNLYGLTKKKGESQMSQQFNQPPGKPEKGGFNQPPGKPEKGGFNQPPQEGGFNQPPQ